MEKKEKGLHCLLFESVGQRFAMEVVYVEEVILLKMIISVPMSPPFVKGVINLRGRVVTVISVKDLFGLKGEEGTSEAMVVFKIPNMELSMIVDSVIGIDNLQAGLIAEVGMQDEGSLSLIKGVIQHNGYPVSLLDMGKLMSFIVEFDYQGKKK